jgi:hypothetical protein
MEFGAAVAYTHHHIEFETNGPIQSRPAVACLRERTDMGFGAGASNLLKLPKGIHTPELP